MTNICFGTSKKSLDAASNVSYTMGKENETHLEDAMKANAGAKKEWWEMTDKQKKTEAYNYFQRLGICPDSDDIAEYIATEDAQ